MYKIQTNSSGTRSIEIAEEHLETIEQYQLFRDLIDSNGYVDEQGNIVNIDVDTLVQLNDILGASMSVPEETVGISPEEKLTELKKKFPLNISDFTVLRKKYNEGSFQEESCNLLKTLFLCLRCKIRVLVASH